MHALRFAKAFDSDYRISVYNKILGESITWSVMLIHLHAHSYYSFLRAIPSPLELASIAAENHMPAIALTDFVSMSGCIEFYDACFSLGIQPILGLEFPIRVELPANEMTNDTNLLIGRRVIQTSTGILVFLAMDLTGWKNLCYLSSSMLSQPATSAFPLELLDSYTDGLICLTGGRRGLFAQELAHAQPSSFLDHFQRLSDLFPNSLYLELNITSQESDPGYLRWFTNLLRISNTLKLPTVVTSDIHYLQPEDELLHHIVNAIRLNEKVENLPAKELAYTGSYFRTEREVLQRLSDLPIDLPGLAISRTEEIAKRCKLVLPLGVPHYPIYESGDDTNPLQILRSHSEAGVRKLYGQISPDLQQRLDHELDTIEACGYTSLFLIMEEIINFAKKSGIPVSSRGSAASSLVAHSLGITSPDPISLNLYFERFLNPMRATPPDIDTDICSRRRDEVIQFVYRHFGEQRVAMVSTVNRFRRRSALREVAKAYGLPSHKINQLMRKLPRQWYSLAEHTLTDDSSYDDLIGVIGPPHEKEILSYAKAIIDFPRHLSIHPGGMVISPGPMTDLVPVQPAPKGVTITQFDLGSIERLGLLKIDLLGIRGLSVLGDVATFLNREQKGDSENPLQVLDKIPGNDPLTSATIREGRTIGCFQIESPGMRATLREIQASSPDDIMVALALFRPGPLTGGLKNIFVKRFNEYAHGHPGKSTSKDSPSLHPALDPILRETYGVILYQEQVLRIAYEVAGFSLVEADLLRRAMSHFDIDRQMHTLKQKFLVGAENRHQIPEQMAEKIWELMAAFAGYGFPKAHAASYAQVAWKSAWCKSHYPAIFMTAVLANWGGYYSQRVYLTEARRMGLNCCPPNVNYAGYEFSLRFLKNQAHLFMGLNQVRDLTHKTQAKIVRMQPYHSLNDFIERVDPRPQELQNLILAGSFDDFGEMPELLAQVQQRKTPNAQLQLFDDNLKETPSDALHWTLREKVAAQELVLGVSLLAHPLEIFATEIQSSASISTVDAILHLGERVSVAGMRQAWRRSRTRDNKELYILSLEDLEGMLDVIIPGDVHRKYQQYLSGSGPFIITGDMTVNSATSEPQLLATAIVNLAR